MIVRVFRYAPERTEEFRVEARPGMTVLDALVEIQRRQDPTLAFRYACRVGMCGSCAMVVNGRERWACRTRLESLGDGAVTVRPLYHFPLLRDLVVDMAPFVRTMRAAGAAFVGKGAAGFAVVGAGSRERRQIDAAIECIGCGMCLSACTMVGWDRRFLGPAALTRAFTLAADSRDNGDRSPGLLSEDALLRCHLQGNCTDVCPMGIPITESILELRRKSIFRALRGRPALDPPRDLVVA